MNLNGKLINQLLIVFAVITLLGLGIFYFFYLLPTSRDLSTANDQLVNEEEYLAVLQENKASADVDDGQLLEYLERIPPKPFMEYWLVELEEIQERSETNIDSFNFSRSELEYSLTENDEDAEDNSSALQQIDATLSVEADSYEQLYSFLEELENLNRITTVSSFSFSEPSITDSGTSIMLDINISTYYMNEFANQFPNYELDGSFVSPEERSNPFQ
ncbi:Tfp pilus assembly protein PilO [Natronobacillus azotifigens]|uniref:Type 4a pilus biogenesis protein PilO n=1 Tax=Natronobacillus azotifigens TaxID=472978 RepID=A0A9J6RAR6_9BACI|nr:type 4a pilus biogenesis protein PilO [Natronobacillus azotifigens]MCZ0702404.1 type 4a pilus biogenesis protein PilO [Natronobacillus azotifigens]